MNYKKFLKYSRLANKHQKSSWNKWNTVLNYWTALHKMALKHGTQESFKSLKAQRLYGLIEYFRIID